MNIAIHNLHELPNLFNISIHDYVLDLLRSGKVKFLFFDINKRCFNVNTLRLLKRYWEQKDIKFGSIPWNNIEFVFSSKKLRNRCDVLLNFNSHLGETQFTPAVKKFDGLKIYHVNDYFWNNPGSKLNKLYCDFGVDHLFGYAAHDRYCAFFQKTFPKYKGKVWGVPFGFSPRFKFITPFKERISKAVALGSVNPIREPGQPPKNYQEPADFFADEVWLHKFRRMLVLNKDKLGNSMDSMLPEYPHIKDFKYDLVQKFNGYKMFITCESIYFFTPAKSFEGPACGCVNVCANHPCNKDYGFEDGENCIMYNLYDIKDCQEKIEYYQKNLDSLEKISERAFKFVNNNFSHKAVAIIIYNYVDIIYKNPHIEARLLKEYLNAINQPPSEHILPAS